jgi:hypothetical protein
LWYLDPTENKVVTGTNGIVLGIDAFSLTSEQTFFYSSQWQVIQQDTQSPVQSPQVANQYVWGQAYVKRTGPPQQQC